jgi:broad specificity phosphatase PhoE
MVEESSKIYIFRHGETDKNAQGINTGQRTPARLNHIGMQHAQNAAEWMRTNNPDTKIILCSPLPRALDTAGYIADKAGATILVREELIEGDLGEIDGLSNTEAEARFPDFYEVRRHPVYKLYIPWPGGESYLDVRRRIVPVVKELKEAKYDIAVVGHRMLNKALIAGITDTPLDKW